MVAVLTTQNAPTPGVWVVLVQRLWTVTSAAGVRGASAYTHHQRCNASYHMEAAHMGAVSRMDEVYGCVAASMQGVRDKLQCTGVLQHASHTESSAPGSRGPMPKHVL